MHTLKIKTYSQNEMIVQPHFYILSKGNNAGKPLTEPCPNCFVFLAKDEQEKDFYYWLCFGLWQGAYFRQFLTGSVIPFIRLNELKQLIKDSAFKVNEKPQQYSDSINLLKQIDKHSKVLDEQIILYKQAKKAIMYKVLRA